MARKRSKERLRVSRKGNAAYVGVTFSISMAERLNALCERHGLARADFIRRATEAALDRAEIALKGVPTLDELMTVKN